MENKTMSQVQFEQFWLLYPRRQAKQPARKKFLKLPADLFDKIMKAVEDQKQSDQWKKGFIPHATTWLNQERWDDEVFTAPAEQKRRIYTINGQEVSEQEYLRQKSFK